MVIIVQVKTILNERCYAIVTYGKGKQLERIVYSFERMSKWVNVNGPKVAFLINLF